MEKSRITPGIDGYAAFRRSINIETIDSFVFNSTFCEPPCIRNQKMEISRITPENRRLRRRKIVSVNGPRAILAAQDQDQRSKT